MKRACVSSLILLIFLFSLSPFLSHASDITLEKSKTIIKKAERKLKTGSPVTDEINQLKTLSEDIKVSHLLLQERFRLRQQRAKALERHQKMSEGNPQLAIDRLKILLNKILQKNRTKTDRHNRY